MIPENDFKGLFLKVLGHEAFISYARYTLLHHIQKIKNGRTHTFLSLNGQTEDGFARNQGAERFYTWPDTIIDCRLLEGVQDHAALENFAMRAMQSRPFRSFQRAITQRSGQYISAALFLKIIKGHDNKRYNICLESKYESFDTIRIGLKISAQSADDFERGLKHLLDWEMRHHPDFKNVFVMPMKTPA